MLTLTNQNEEVMVKLQKDFTRDMIEHFKNLLQDLDVACGTESSQEAKDTQEKLFDKAYKDNVSQEAAFEIFYQILQPKIEDIILE